MSQSRLASYLWSHRKRSGLSQKEVADLLGISEGEVSRHERMSCAPSLRVALGYQAIFRVSIGELFPGLFDAIRDGVETRLEKLREEFQQSDGKGRGAALIARKLEWMWERQHEDQSGSTHAANIA